MRWPWTSRARLDDVLTEVARLREDHLREAEEHDRFTDFLREQLLSSQAAHTAAVEALTRVTRASNGLAEVPHEPRKPPEEIPAELVKIVSGFGNEALRKRIYQVALSRRARGESWQVIIAEAKKSTVEGL
jgi:hypothetical protein